MASALLVDSFEIGGFKWYGHIRMFNTETKLQVSVFERVEGSIGLR